MISHSQQLVWRVLICTSLINVYFCLGTNPPVSECDHRGGSSTREGILKAGWWCPGHSAADTANTCYETLANSVLLEAILCCTLSHEINRKRLNPYCAAFSSHKLKFMQAVYFGRVSLDIGQMKQVNLGQCINQYPF